MGNGIPINRQAPPFKLLIRHRLSPGDVLVMTAAIEALKRQHPGRYRVMVDTTCDAVFENNPHVEQLVHGECHPIELEYPLIHRSNQEPRHFLEGFVLDLAKKLEISLKLDSNRPTLYLSDAEKVRPTDLPEKYIVINAGHKSDYTAKHPGTFCYQEVVTHFKGRLEFVQVGEKHHKHQVLNGVIDRVGKTSVRQLIQLAYHSAAGVGPVTFLHHIMGAIQKPYVCYSGGREPVSWEQYPTATMLTSVGQLSCCKHGGCWKSRVVKLGDGSTNDASLCEKPVEVAGETIPQCMAMLGSAAAIRALEGMLAGGMIPTSRVPLPLAG